jgi:hypothetical protein
MMKRFFLALLGLIIIISSPVISQAQSASALPPSVDLRPFFYPVQDQMYRGSCAAFAALAAVEMLPGVPKLSEAYAYAKLKADDLEFDGTTLFNLKKFLDATPIVEEKLMPYQRIGVFGFNDSNVTEIQIAKAYNRTKAKEARTLEPYAIYQATDIQVFQAGAINPEWIRERLAQARPVVGAFRINSADWANDANSSGKIGYTVGSLVSIPDGGHAVVIVGYNIEEDSFIIRNSWGLDWGMQGYAHMSTAYLRKYLTSVMTVGRAEAKNLFVQKNSSAPEKFDIRVHGLLEADSTITGFFSFILNDRAMNNSPINGIYYRIYDAQNRTAPPVEGWGNSNMLGFPFIVNKLRTPSVYVEVTITHADGGQTTGSRTIADIFTWSSGPIIR